MGGVMGPRRLERVRGRLKAKGAVLVFRALVMMLLLLLLPRRRGKCPNKEPASLVRVEGHLERKRLAPLRPLLCSARAGQSRGRRGGWGGTAAPFGREIKESIENERHQWKVNS